jgi:HD-like signal output (HDOD) protein/CheY-like chemotaxis protein
MSSDAQLFGSNPDNPIAGAYVLTVDDFSVIRRIVVNTLRMREADVDEAPNGKVGLDKMHLALQNNVPYDLVFLDIEMPVMDGISFLRAVKGDEQLKDTPVILLTSHSEEDEIMACLKLGAADYLIKPVTKDRMLAAVSKALAGRKPNGSRLRPESGSDKEQVPEYAKIIFRKLESIDTLPTLPMVLEQIKELTNDPRSNNDKIAGIMEEEPSMMANVLKVANSALYGARERIDSLQMAITRLGLNTVRNMATSMGVLNAISQVNVDGFNHEEFCKHSICTGIAMCVLNEMCRGLLHDIGKLIIVQFFSKEMDDAIALGKKHSLPMFLAEQKALGIDHGAVGAWLAQKWNLSENQISVIKNHHDPLLANQSDSEQVLLCHLGNYICNQQKLGDGGDTGSPFFDQRVFDILGLTMDDVPEVVRRVQLESKKSEVLVSLMKKS